MATLSSETHAPRSEVLHRGSARSNAAQFETLYELVARLAACTDLASALWEVLEASIDVVEADAGYIRFFERELADPISSRYPFAVHKGISEGYVEYFGSLVQPVSDSARQALYDGRRIIVEDMMSHPAFEVHRAIVIPEGYRTLLATPMMSPNGSRCVGVIVAYFRDIQTPPYTGLETLDLYAELAASIIDHHRQMAELARRERSWEAIVAEQADVLRWTRERMSDLEDKAARLQPQQVTQLAHSFASRLEQVESARPGEAAEVPDDQYVDNPYGLSPSELEILINVWRGLSDKETAAEMGISRFTVAKYLGSAMRKLNVEDRTQASHLLDRDILAREGGLSLPFRDLLRTFRRRAGLTQSELAEKAGLSHRTISDLERGVRTKVYISTVDLLSAALELEQGDATLLAASVDRSRKTPRIAHSGR